MGRTSVPASPTVVLGLHNLDSQELITKVKSYWPSAISFHDLNDHDLRTESFFPPPLSDSSLRLEYLNDRDVISKLATIQRLFRASGLKYYRWANSVTPLLSDDFVFIADWADRARPTWFQLLERILDCMFKCEYFLSARLELEHAESFFCVSESDNALSVIRRVIKTARVAAFDMKGALAIKAARDRIQELVPSALEMLKSKDNRAVASLDEWLEKLLMIALANPNLEVSNRDTPEMPVLTNGADTDMS